MRIDIFPAAHFPRNKSSKRKWEKETGQKTRVAEKTGMKKLWNERRKNRVHIKFNPFVNSQLFCQLNSVCWRICYLFVNLLADGRRPFRKLFARNDKQKKNHSFKNLRRIKNNDSFRFFFFCSLWISLLTKMATKKIEEKKYSHLFAWDLLWNTLKCTKGFWNRQVLLIEMKIRKNDEITLGNSLCPVQQQQTLLHCFRSFLFVHFRSVLSHTKSQTENTQLEVKQKHSKILLFVFFSSRQKEAEQTRQIKMKISKSSEK